MLTNFEFKLLVNYVTERMHRRDIFGDVSPQWVSRQIELELGYILEATDVKIADEEKVRVTTAVEEKL